MPTWTLANDSLVPLFYILTRLILCFFYCDICIGHVIENKPAAENTESKAVKCCDDCLILYIYQCAHLNGCCKQDSQTVGQWTNQLFHVWIVKVQCDNFTAVTFDPFYSWLWYDYSHKNLQENKQWCPKIRLWEGIHPYY